MIGNLFGQGFQQQQCPRDSVRQCRKAFKKGIKTFVEQMKAQNSAFESKE